MFVVMFSSLSNLPPDRLCTAEGYKLSYSKLVGKDVVEKIVGGCQITRNQSKPLPHLHSDWEPWEPEIVASLHAVIKQGRVLVRAGFRSTAPKAPPSQNLASTRASREMSRRGRRGRCSTSTLGGGYWSGLV